MVRPLGDVPGGPHVTVVEDIRTPNAEQLAAIDAPGLVFVSAGAGTGKTTVLVERFVRAVCDRGLPIDSVLAITYTERAAGELRGRIRARLAELDRHDLARQLDGAWISTIHGFCHRLLKAQPFEAAVHPSFRGQRVGDEAARLFQRHLVRDLGFHRLQLEIYGFNERGLLHAERAGFRREGVRRKAYWRNDEWVDSVLFGLVAEDLEEEAS